MIKFVGLADKRNGQEQLQLIKVIHHFWVPSENSIRSTWKWITICSYA